MTAGDGGYAYRDMADAAGRALGRAVHALPMPRAVMAAMAAANSIGHSLGRPVQILTPGKVREIFHPRLDGPRSQPGRSDWGSAARYDLPNRLLPTRSGGIGRQGWL